MRYFCPVCERYTDRAVRVITDRLVLCSQRCDHQWSHLEARDKVELIKHFGTINGFEEGH